MKFLLDIDVQPEDGRGEITAEQFREHLQTYEFGPMVSFQMSLIPDDPDHEKGTYPEDYRNYRVTRVEVTAL